MIKTVLSMMFMTSLTLMTARGAEQLTANATNQTQVTAGDLDPTFGIGGKVTTDFQTSSRVLLPDIGEALALQPDGKIIVAGSAAPGGTNGFALARYNLDGTLDMAFGSGGKVTTAVGNSQAFAHAVVLQSDGKIIAVGTANIVDTFALARYNADGTLDTTFGVGGKVTTAFGTDGDGAFAALLQADGKIVAAGFTTIGNGPTDFALARYNTDGTLDASFGSGGKVTTDFAAARDFAEAIALQTDGKIVAAGFTTTDTNHVVLARYNVDGSLDQTFGIGGKITSVFSPADIAFAVTIQTDARIVIAGSVTLNSGDSGFLVVRYNSNGTLDASFGTGGEVATEFSGGFALSVVVQSNGRVLAAGQASPNSATDFALARYNRNGALDTTFGVGGKVTTNFGNGNDSVNAVALQSDGKIVAAGYASVIGTDFAVARYLNRQRRN